MLDGRSVQAWKGLASAVGRLVALAAAAAGLFALAMVRPAAAESRIALVIGNGAYQNAPVLPNPPNDAADVAVALKRSNFDTIVATDLDKAGMDEALIRFARSARTADVALFYYSGHAIQFGGVNYLAPIDTRLRDEADLRRMVRLDEVVADLQQAKNLRILVLDSCRDNPLADELKRAIGATRAMPLQRGLAKIDSAQGMIVSYATQAGRTAEDGGGRNSPYTASFLKHIGTAEEIGTIFRRVSNDVYESTNRAQLPELSLSLIGEYYLHDRDKAPANGTPASSNLAVASLSGPSNTPPARPPSPAAAAAHCADFSGNAGIERYCASSVLPAQAGISYGVANLFANDPSRAWVEGKANHGVGEWILVEFKTLRAVQAIKLRNGYQKSADLFRKNSRIRRVTVVFSQGKRETFEIADQTGEQTYEWNEPVNAYWVQLILEEVFPGTTYKDTAMSGLRIVSEPADRQTGAR